MGVHWKIQLFGGGRGLKKKTIYRGDSLKGGLAKERGCFWGGLISQYTLWFLENKTTILGIKGHFGEEEGHSDLRTRALATSLPLLEWSFWDVSSQNKISKIFIGTLFFHGSDILTLNSLKYTLHSDLEILIRVRYNNKLVCNIHLNYRKVSNHPSC